MKCIICGLEEVEESDGNSYCRLCHIEEEVKSLKNKVNKIISGIRRYAGDDVV